MQQVRFFTVTEDEQGQRLDNYLLARLKGVPRSAVYRIVRKGEVRVNKGRAKPDRKVCAGDVVRIPPLALAESRAPVKPSDKFCASLENRVLYDQNGLLVVDKPAGVAVHGGSGIQLGLVEALRQMPRFKGFLELVHRLDRDTSGVIMLARKRAVLTDLQERLRAREGVEKTYLALVQGRWPANLPYIDVPLLRTVLANNERLVRVHKDGKESLTRFRVLARNPKATLMQARPVTGRTHQIRVHAKHAGCALVGDRKYGDNPENISLAQLAGNRLFLHAYSLKFEFLGESMVFRAQLPDELHHCLRRLEMDPESALLGLK